MEMQNLDMKIQDTVALEDATGQEGSSGVNSTKNKHNAKERLRRLNLNASYTALRYLLPNSKKSKKRWSASKILERSLKYIPALLDELRRLTLAKESRTALSKENKNKNKSNVTDNNSITITEVANGEFSLQICPKRATSDLLSNLMCKVEDSGMSVKGVSSVEISDGVICCHLHIEMNANQRPGDDYIAILRDDLASWLN